MIEYVTGDLLEADAEVLVNTVNTVGTMGKGLALQFKRKYPDMAKVYTDLCHQNLIKPGIIWVWWLKDQSQKPYGVVNFPTKRHWRNPSKLEYIDDGLMDLVNFIVVYKVKSIALPALGCGLGGLEFKDVYPLLETHLRDLDCHVMVYLPSLMVLDPILEEMIT